MSFSEAVSSVFRQYATFSGRAPRSEYWFFQLFNLLVILAAYGIAIVLLIATRSVSVLGVLLLAVAVYALATLIPSLAVTVRRLHDSDRSGWWLLIALVPYLGAIILLIFMVLPSTRRPNRFGPPYGQSIHARIAYYQGANRPEALRMFAEDAERAAAAGYQPIWQEWKLYTMGEVLEVGYDLRSAGPAWATPSWPVPPPPADGPPAGPSAG
jgi:uncharacterized membrane protein YhaH (DUF805 family)